MNEDKHLQLQLGEFVFSLRNTEKIRLNKFANATLRGAFGNALKSTLCIQSKIPEKCEKCLIRKTCAYYYLFETGTDSQGENDPHPFTLFITPELTNKIMQIGEVFNFKMILIGKGLDFIPHIIYAIENLGKIGLGAYRGKLDLIDVRSVKNEIETIIYSQSDKILRIRNQDFLFEPEINNKSVNHINISLLTPLRMKHEGKLVTEINFKVFIVNLLRRISTIIKIHCQETVSIDWSGLLKICENTTIIKDNTYWKEYKRYSGRQKQEMLLGGLRGNFEIQGELTALMPYLYLGKHIHVGKSTSFGFGKYEMQII